MAHFYLIVIYTIIDMDVAKKTTREMEEKPKIRVSPPKILRGKEKKS